MIRGKDPGCQTQILPAAALLVAAALMTADAKSASEVFEAVASSAVVVQVEDSGGKVHGFGSGVIIATGQVVTVCHAIEKAGYVGVKRGQDTQIGSATSTAWR